MNYAKRTLDSWQLVTLFRKLLIAIHEILSNRVIRAEWENPGDFQLTFSKHFVKSNLTFQPDKYHRIRKKNQILSFVSIKFLSEIRKSSEIYYYVSYKREKFRRR